MATATKNPPKNDPASNFGRALRVVVVVDGVAVVKFPSVGRQHTTEKTKSQPVTSASYG